MMQTACVAGAAESRRGSSDAVVDVGCLMWRSAGAVDAAVNDVVNVDDSGPGLIVVAVVVAVMGCPDDAAVAVGA